LLKKILLGLSLSIFPKTKKPKRPRQLNFLRFERVCWRRQNGVVDGCATTDPTATTVVVDCSDRYK